MLLSIIEQPEADRTAILEAIFGNREDIVARLARAADPATRARVEKALNAYDYVYDIPHAAAPAA